MGGHQKVQGSLAFGLVSGTSEGPAEEIVPLLERSGPAQGKLLKGVKGRRAPPATLAMVMWVVRTVELIMPAP